MPSNPKFSATLKKEFFNTYSILAVIITSFVYYSISVLLLNIHLAMATLFGNFPITYKYNLLSALVLGSPQPLGMNGFILLAVTSLLVGVNAVTVFKNLKKLKRSGGTLTISVGGSAVIGVFVAGCTSCGFSVFALVGLTAAVSLFPFEGLLIGLLIISLLTASLAYSLRTLHREVYCKIK